MNPSLAALGIVNALGRGKAAVAPRLFAGDTSGLVLEEGWIPGHVARVGRVQGDLPALPEAWWKDDSRNNRLLLLALEEVRPELEAALVRWGRDRIGVVLGTSTSGMASGEAAVAQHRKAGTHPEDYHYRQQEIGRTAPFLAAFLGLRGPALTLSTACTSSGRALATAWNLLESGLCDAVLAGGVDSLSGVTLNGFTALEATTETLTNPMSAQRRGINIGEGAALFLLTREPGPLVLAGLGESSDAHHISSPDPSGAGVVTALRQALAGHDGSPVYLNLHATATEKNDAMEARAVAEVFPGGVRCSGTKPLTGHTLGAAAATELAFGWLTLHPAWNPEGLLAPHVWDGVRDETFPALDLVATGDPLGSIRTVLSSSMAFGGNNLCLRIEARD